MSEPTTAAVTTALIKNARIVTPETVIDGAIRVADGRITDVVEGDAAIDADTVLNVSGRVVLPGLIDLHGDDIESHLHPRSGVRMTPHMALASADRANVAAGITTKFHAISFELDEDAGRSPELGAELTASIERADDLLADHRIHARCEVTQERCVDAVSSVVAAGDADLVSVMSHIPGKGQFGSEDAFLDYYRNSGDHTLAEAQTIIEERGDVTLERLRERVDHIVALADEHGVPTASHDDEDAAEVERLHERGVDITEYPITLETAERAHDLGMTVTMGAPNLVRGDSQWGNLRTADAIDAGVVDALVADYHPPSLLAGAFVDTGEPLPERVARVTTRPAAAAGLDDRGRIECGARADLVVVDPEPTPTVTEALVAGQPVYRADPMPEGRR